MHDFLGLPLQASSHAHYIDESITAIHWLMFALFAGWSAFFVYTLVRYRQKANPRANYAGLKSKFPLLVVGAVAVLEFSLLFGVDIPLWAKLTKDIPSENEATVIRIVAEQFAWNAHYPGADGVFGKTDITLITSDNPLGLDRDDPPAKDDITTINNISMPVHKPVLVYLSSKDVIHSFGIALLRVKQDAIPGQRVKIAFTPTVTSGEIQQSFLKKYPISATTDPSLFAVLSVGEDYKGADGTPVASKGDIITSETLTKLAEAGVKEMAAFPSTPVEVACAQLCGLGHYRMRSSVNILSAEDYQKWLAEEASYLTQ
jgi:cytochrome c oxidase subunit 2